MEPSQEVEGRSTTRLIINDPQTVGISLAISPQQAVVASLRCSALRSGPRAKTPAATAHGVRFQLAPRSRFAFDSFSPADGVVIPDVCLPIAPFCDVSVAEQVDYLRSMPIDVLPAELRGEFGDAVPDGWQPAIDHPRRWLHSWASASQDMWTATAPRWRAASRALDRETRRVAMAVVRGGTDVLLNSLHPRVGYRDGAITVRDCMNMSQSLAGRRLVLVPMVGTGDALLTSFDKPDLAYIAYPLPRVAPRAPAGAAGTTDDDGDPLELVVGAPRAAILRALSRTYTVGQLAAASDLPLTNTIYHCDHLDHAALITRDRDGRHVLVSRTRRGDELVDLLSA